MMMINVVFGLNSFQKQYGAMDKQSQQKLCLLWSEW